MLSGLSGLSALSGLNASGGPVSFGPYESLTYLFANGVLKAEETGAPDLVLTDPAGNTNLAAVDGAGGTYAQINGTPGALATHGFLSLDLTQCLSGGNCIVTGLTTNGWAIEVRGMWQTGATEGYKRVLKMAVTQDNGFYINARLGIAYTSPGQAAQSMDDNAINSFHRFFIVNNGGTISLINGTTPFTWTGANTFADAGGVYTLPADKTVRFFCDDTTEHAKHAIKFIRIYPQKTLAEALVIAGAAAPDQATSVWA